MVRITAVFEKGFVIISFQKGCMTLTEMRSYILTGRTDIRKHPHVNSSIGYNKAMWIGSIVKFWKTGDSQTTDGYRMTGVKGNDQLFLDFKVPELQSV